MRGSASAARERLERTSKGRERGRTERRRRRTERAVQLADRARGPLSRQQPVEAGHEGRRAAEHDQAARRRVQAVRGAQRRGLAQRLPGARAPVGAPRRGRAGAAPFACAAAWRRGRQPIPGRKRSAKSRGAPFRF